MSTLSDEAWARAETIFLAALEKPENDRPAFVRAAAGDDPALEREVLSLLSGHERGPIDDHLERRSVRWVGPYRLLRDIGSGGMGTVFLAERVGDGFRQRVALKLLRSDYVSPLLVERLTREREILARLEHPGIARLIDGGTTPSGQPYLAMEYVDGQDLMAHCDSQGLELHDRLRLLVAVCDAVKYAHGRLVVHRDIKPGNVLVTPDGCPKLLDFGIAKLLDDAAAPGASGQTGFFVTPAYASPEQMRREPATTAADVYALGAVTYQLITGRLPLEVPAGSWVAVEATVCYRDPERPSAVLRAAGRGRLGRLVEGDLDRVILKALAKDPAARYGSAEEFGTDLQRYLDGLPVAARPLGPVYRFGRFVRRHRGPVAAAIVAVLALVTGLAVALWQRQVAQVERDRAELARQASEDATEFLVGLFERADPTQGLTDAATGRELLREGIMRAEGLDAHPAMRARLYEVLGGIALRMGDLILADSLTRLSLAQFEQLSDLDALPGALSQLGAIERRRYHFDSAFAIYARVLELQASTLPPADPALALTHLGIGRVAGDAGMLDSMVAAYSRAVAIRERALGLDHPLTGEAWRTLAAAKRAQGRSAEALGLMTQLESARRRTLGPDHPDVGEALVFMADWLAEDFGQLDSAEVLYRRALTIQTAALGEHMRLVHGLTSLAGLRLRRGDPEDAETLARRARAISLRANGPDHPSVVSIDELLGRILLATRRHQEGLALLRKALADRRRLHGNTDPRVAGALTTLAQELQRHGDAAGAERAMEEALAIRVATWGEDALLVAWTHRLLGELRLERGDLAGASASLDRAAAIAGTRLEPAHRDMQALYRALTVLHERTGRTAEAARFRSKLRADARTGPR